MKQFFRLHTFMLLWIVSACIAVVANAQPGIAIVNVMDFGAKGDGVSNDANFIQAAIDACAAKGGGTILFPGDHTFLSGPLQLRSNMQINLPATAILKASPDEKLYTESAFKENRGEGMLWLHAKDVSNLSFTGTGSIDGNGISFMGAELDDSYELKPFNISDPRPHVLTIINGKNIRIHDLHIGNSAYWTVHLVGCNDVVISGITLLNSLKVRNSDGIDVDHSKNVRISDCYIESGDDCICLKNRREYEEYGSCENISVTNCTMTSRSCAIKIGSENMDTIRQVVFNNCIIKKSNRGVGIQNRDEGTVSDVIFSNMIIESHFFSDVWWGKSEPIYVTAYRRANGNNKDANWRFPKGATEGRVGAVSNISFSNIVCTGENSVYVSAESPDKLSNIRFDQVDITVSKTTGFPGGMYDRRPANVTGLVPGRTAGFFLENATSITLRNCSVAWGKEQPAYFGNVVESHNVGHLAISNLEGEAAFPSLEKINKE